MQQWLGVVHGADSLEIIPESVSLISPDLGMSQVPFLFSFVHLTTRDQDDFVASDVWVPKP